MANKGGFFGRFGKGKGKKNQKNDYDIMNPDEVSQNTKRAMKQLAKAAKKVAKMIAKAVKKIVELLIKSGIVRLDYTCCFNYCFDYSSSYDCLEYDTWNDER